VRAALDVGLDDVVLATVAGALRGYLDAAGHTLDDLTVRALVPSSTPVAAGAPGGVAVAGTVVPLPVSEAGALERVEALRAARAERVAADGAEAGDLLALAGFAPPALVGVAARLLPMQRAVSLSVAAVIGPRSSRRLMGAEVREVFAYVGPVDGVGLVVTALSYAGTLGVALCADRDSVSDLDVLADSVGSAFSALERAATTGGTRR
jgi:hypothetical protein